METSPLTEVSGDEQTSDLISAPKHYRIQVTLVLLYLAFFVLLYLALLGAIGYLLHSSVQFTAVARGAVFVLGATAVALLAVLLLYLSRPIFFQAGAAEAVYFEVRPEDQPALFSFIRSLCEQIDAPLPR